MGRDLIHSDVLVAYMRLMLEPGDLGGASVFDISVSKKGVVTLQLMNLA